MLSYLLDSYQVLHIANNFKAIPSKHQSNNGYVPDGFWDMYSSFKFVDIDGNVSQSEFSVAIKEKMKEHEQEKITVTGHSLGAAFASYLSYDLSFTKSLRNNIKMVAFGCPRVGSEDFVEHFHKIVKNYVVYNYSQDIVPTVPPKILGFRDLKNIREINPKNSDSVIRNDIISNHHHVAYAAMLDYGLCDWEKVLNRNKMVPGEVIGPNNGIDKEAKSSLMRDVFLNNRNLINRINKKTDDSGNKPKS